MLFYYYIYFALALFTLYLLIRFLVIRKKDISIDFFITAQRSENNGFFEDAVVAYEEALTEAKKTRSHTMLKNKIIEKLKVLHTVIEYKNSFHYVRQDF